MAYHCSSPPPSSLFHDRLPLCNSLSSSPILKPKTFTHSLNLNSLSFHSKTTLQIAHVSLQGPIPLETQNQNPTKDSIPDRETGSSSKHYIWVNPKSPRASQLRQRSYDSRYASLVKKAESLDNCNPKEDDVYGILSGLGDNLLEQDAVVIINNMTNPETALLSLKYFQKKSKFHREVVLYNVTMKVFRKCKDLERAEKLFDEMLDRGVKPDIITFSTIISCARISGFPEKAVEWFEKMPSYGCEPDEVTNSAMIDAYGRAGNVDMALSLYDRARTEKWRIDPLTFSTLIKMYVVSGNYDGCLNVYEEMKALGVKPNIVIYNSLIDAMGRAKRPWQAKNIYKEMTDNGFTANWATYAALLRAYGRARHGDDALDVYKEMKEKGMELNLVLYNTMLSMCADVGYIDEAFEIFNDFKYSRTCKPDSWTFSSLITIYSCSGKVSEAEAMLNEMLDAGFEPNIFVLTSIIQCYGKAQRTDDVVRTFNRLLDLGIIPDERFCGCLLNVMTQTPKEDLGKLSECIEKANSKLGNMVKLLVENLGSEGNFKEEASELFDSISADVKKAYCNCLIDLCVNLNLLDCACELLDLGLKLGIYKDIQSRSPTQWSLHLKSLSLGAALTALHVWINDLSKALISGEELPPLLGINTGHGKHKFSEKGLAVIFESHLKELNAPFHEAPDKVGWFLTTKTAAKSWLDSRSSPELLAT
ncbi:PPR domain-containing protein/PPR_1 domain-containing protein/PPR_2 domain-containing protein/PPR_3 domain-containing protein [Cephalotus follicularis]|uniref:PPR domain-containing protein/PPR_1 domain-containing protein/PPR_2 domain-containing protein/PPR_3 domain-containing protein n=1 Tax=Cephalotus follicularis TaxID=3775 RepID=A0A1Q3AW05_CEPFO|nr:PPR domain-containing protein/PPR_1 domain-containing protein/PPR_2 domain-containing protein/PPR_3 domain-containing protein [Cephalotus follicularis]